MFRIFNLERQHTMWVLFVGLLLSVMILEEAEARFGNGLFGIRGRMRERRYARQEARAAGNGTGILQFRSCGPNGCAQAEDESPPGVELASR